LNKDNDKELFQKVIRRSFTLSVDGAQGVHPNYSEYYEVTSHGPKLGKGIALKQHINNHYSTDTIGSTIFRDICD